MLRWLLLILCSVGYCRSESGSKYTFVKEASEAPAVCEYDYIIVGGGTAGCPLAATLSQNFTVLVLERGGSPYGNSNITNLASFADTLTDQSPASASQRFVSEDGVINARARVLGGGTCLNAGFYTRASQDYVRQAGWSDARLVNQSYEWVERLIVFEPPMRQWQSAVRDGLLEAGVTPYNGFTYDHIIGTKVGGTIFDREGHRHTAADLLEYADAGRLTVLLRATALRILWKTASLKWGKRRPAAYGVIYRDGTGKEKKAYVRRGGEVIVAAGAIGSPQLLMLSGVGPGEELEKLGIELVLNQPFVGKGLADNPMNAIFVPSPNPVEISLIEVVGITRFGTYIEAASGHFFASTTGDRPSLTGHLSTVQAEAIERSVDQSAFRGGFILEKIIGPLSTGHLQLKTLNPDDNPSVTFNYFSDPLDLQRCVEGIKTIKNVIQSNAFSKFRYPFISFEAMINMTVNFPMNLLPKHNTDSTSLDQFCKDTVMTIWHYHGGCQVGTVVSNDYRVIGVDALRVIDGSTLKFSPGTNPQATVMMLGRYMGVQILNKRMHTR